MCYRGKSINFQIYEGRSIKPKHGSPSFCLGLLTYISRAVDPGFELDTPSDNRPVCLASNFHKAELTSMARRWNVTKRSRVYISQQHAVKVYNKLMGGVDLLDRFISDYRPQLRSKKWWWCRFANFVNTSVVDGWMVNT